MSMSTSAITDFITYALGQKEVSLVIAKDEEELASLKRELDVLGFASVNTPLEFSIASDHPGKAYSILADASHAKDYYDFSVQYPTGQVEMWNRSTMQPQVSTPRYEGVTLVLLLTKDTLVSAQKNGMDFLASTGIVYQS